MSDGIESRPTLLNRQEAAKSLRISERTLFNWTKMGLLPHVRCGRAIRYRPETLDNFAKDHEQR